jgi:hypothetical protein
VTVTPSKRRTLAKSTATRQWIPLLLTGIVCLSLWSCSHKAPKSLPSPSTSKPTSTSKPNQGAPTGAYTVSGNKILGKDGKVFVPYGITVYGLSFSQWQPNVTSDEAEIRATAVDWHGNTARIQVDPVALLATSPFDSAMLQQLDAEVKQAEQLHMNVIISAQTEHEPDGGSPMPDSNVQQFWRVLAPHFSADTNVWFDLFNEPRLKGAANDQFWAVWHDGGDGYVGMQTLVDMIRSEGANNIVLAEGIHAGSSLLNLQPLSGRNIAYAVHPYFHRAESPEVWMNNWGRQSSSVPVVADEWNQYASARDECTPNAPTLVPEFLQYITSHDIGLVVWTLHQPGVLTPTVNDYTHPVSFDPSVPYGCEGLPANSHPQGAGQLVMQLFESRSQPGG